MPLSKTNSHPNPKEFYMHQKKLLDLGKTTFQLEVFTIYGITIRQEFKPIYLNQSNKSANFNQKLKNTLSNLSLKLDLYTIFLLTLILLLSYLTIVYILQLILVGNSGLSNISADQLNFASFNLTNILVDSTSTTSTNSKLRALEYLVKTMIIL